MCVPNNPAKKLSTFGNCQMPNSKAFYSYDLPMTKPRRSKSLPKSKPEKNPTITTRSKSKPKPKPKPGFETRFKPDPSIVETSEFDIEKVRILGPEFFCIDAIELAPLLLGKFLRRDNVVLQITEVEAYRSDDSACHGRFGVTARTAPLFGPSGHVYVYLCYGIHMMLNVVADKEGLGAAVLIRSCAPVCGLTTIQQRRGQITDKPVLLAGPGKIGQALGLSTEWCNHPLYVPGGLELLDGPKPEKILVGP